MSDDETDLYYFGYGPIVNDLVRQRRGIHTTEIRAAYLSDYRLTFAIGGLANVVHKRGYEVHGLLMKLAQKEDWKRVQEFDAGSTPTVKYVTPYDAPGGPIKASLVEFPGNIADSLLDGPIEKLPQDRYLNLIALGMRQYHVDNDYIEDNIMAVPFVPKRLPKDFERLPCLKEDVPEISLRKYQQLCRKARGDVYFVLGEGVFRVNKPDLESPAVRWLAQNGHGKEDCALTIHKLVVDPDIPLVDEVSEMSPLHYAWAENHCAEIMEQFGLSCHKVATLERTSDGEGGGTSRFASMKKSLSKRFTR